MSSIGEHERIMIASSKPKPSFVEDRSSRLQRRFSAAEFARCESDRQRSEMLALELEQAVYRRIYRKLRVAVFSLVEELNDAGHSLALVEEQSEDPLIPVGLSFRDERSADAQARESTLCLYFEMMVSVGHPLFVDELEEPSQSNVEHIR